MGFFLKFVDEKLLKKILSKQNYEDLNIAIQTRTLFILWTFTTIVMWLYVLYCYHVFPAGNPVILGGFIFTILHSLVPLVFYFTQSQSATSLSISLTGLGFQTLFCVYSGGIFSPAAIWFTLHPVILGFFGSMTLTVFSVVLNFLIVFSLYFLGEAGMLPLDSLTPFFKNSMIISSYIGLDILVAVFTIATVRLFTNKNNQISESKEQKENLVRILCHDLNNALFIISGTAKLAQKVPFTNVEKHSEYWKRIIKAGNLQQDLIDLVRNIEAVQTGKQLIPLSQVDVMEVLSTVNEIFNERMLEKNIKFDIDDHPLNSIHVLAERVSLLNNVLNNIVSNAMKFSRPGDTISVKIINLENNVIIEIKDQGVGMPEDIRKNLFSKNIPTTRAGTNGEKGTGLGMVLMDAYMKHFHGQVEVETYDISTHPIGHGTLFRLILKKL